MQKQQQHTNKTSAVAIETTLIFTLPCWLNQFSTGSGLYPQRVTHLTHEVGAGGMWVSGQEQQQDSQQHCLQNEERVVDQNPYQDHVPGLFPRPAADASVSDHCADHVDAEESDTESPVHASCQPAEEDMDGKATIK